MRIYSNRTRSELPKGLVIAFLGHLRSVSLGCTTHLREKATKPFGADVCVNRLSHWPYARLCRLQLCNVQRLNAKRNLLLSFPISSFPFAKLLHHHLLCHLRWIETQNRQRRQIDHLFKEIVRINCVSEMPTRDSIDRVQEQRSWRTVG